jgi:phosphatidylglycerol:prolipoprotein diacylglycerol transferase
LYPILLDWGGVVLPAWHTLYVVGALVALVTLLAMRRAYLPELPEQDISRLFALCYLLSYFGARLLSIAVEEPDVRSPGAVVAALFRFGPMTFYGGALTAFFVGAAYVRLRRLRFADVSDLAIPAGLFALALGRVGCFLNGDDYGIPAPLVDGVAPWWAVTFPSLADGVARYPVQLMESASVALVAGILVWRFRQLRAAFRPGVVGFLGIVLYANLRFFLEFLRDDFRGNPLNNWLSTSQLISALVLLAAGLSLPVWIRRAASPNRPSS